MLTPKTFLLPKAEKKSPASKLPISWPKRPKDITPAHTKAAKDKKVAALFKPKDELFRGTDESLWQLWRDGITSSFLGEFLTDREQTRLSYVEGWRSRNEPIYFAFGTCVHWLLEKLYGEAEVATMLQSKTASFIPKIALLLKQYHEKWLTEVPMATQAQLDQQERVYGFAEAILPAYIDRWSGDFTGKYKYPTSAAKPAKWVSLEEIFAVPFTFPDGKKIMIRGRRDGVFTDKHGKEWVFDTKCRSMINDDDAMETLPFDTQQMLYLWVRQQELRLVGGPKRLAGTIMNIVRRPGHRQGVNESLKDFLARIAADVRQVKKYDHNFVRYEMAVSPAEIENWEKAFLLPLLTDVRMWWEGTVPHYLNPNALVTKYGRCAMFHPITKQDFTNCFKREKVFPEL